MRRVTPHIDESLHLGVKSCLIYGMRISCVATANSDGGRHHPNTGFVLEAMRNSLGSMAFDRRSACVCTTTPGSSSRCGTRPKSFLRLSAKPTSCPSEVFYGCCGNVGWGQPGNDSCPNGAFQNRPTDMATPTPLKYPLKH